MECAYADHLRNLALVSISRELRERTKRRSLRTSDGEHRARDSEALVLSRKKIDEDRKALRDHVANASGVRTASVNAHLGRVPKT